MDIGPHIVPVSEHPSSMGYENVNESIRIVPDSDGSRLGMISSLLESPPARRIKARIIARKSTYKQEIFEVRGFHNKPVKGDSTAQPPPSSQVLARYLGPRKYLYTQSFV